MVHHHPDEGGRPLCGVLLLTTTGHDVRQNEKEVNCEACTALLVAADLAVTRSTDDSSVPVGGSRLCACCGTQVVQAPCYVCSDCKRVRRAASRKKLAARRALKGPTLRQRLVEIKANAKVRDIDFALTEQDVAHLSDTPCTYCEKPVRSVHLDRVDNTRGYLPENVVQCCPRCNLWKGSSSVEEFIGHARRVAEHSRIGCSPVLTPLNLTSATTRR